MPQDGSSRTVGNCPDSIGQESLLKANAELSSFACCSVGTVYDLEILWTVWDCWAWFWTCLIMSVSEGTADTMEVAMSKMFFHVWY